MLLRDQLVLVRDGWLIAHPDTVTPWHGAQKVVLGAAGRTWRSGIMPLALLAIGHNRHRKVLTAGPLRACPIMISEAMNRRPGIANYAELALANDVSKPTLRAPRRALKRLGGVEIRVELHSRACLRRVTATSPAGTCCAPGRGGTIPAFSGCWIHGKC